MAAIACYFMWGILPVFWKQMQGISAWELICHRMVWSLFFLLPVLAWQKELRQLSAALTNLKLASLTGLSSLLLAVNWLIYVWGVNHGYVLETSLGYFLTPLCNVLAGRLVFKEKLRRGQWIAIALAGLGVAFLLIRIDHVPWIAFGLAASWSSYSILKKKSTLGSLAGLTAETLILFPFAALVLLCLALRGEGALGHVSAVQHGFVLSAGLVTAVPLLLFGWGAQRLRMTTIGLLQYIGPSIQFLLGRFVYHEALSPAQRWAFIFIWIGLIVYSADSVLAQRQQTR